MNHPYKTREGGATVTIFVPYDCKNHCPFCINKEEYGDMTGFSLEMLVSGIVGETIMVLGYFAYASMILRSCSAAPGIFPDSGDFFRACCSSFLLRFPRKYNTSPGKMCEQFQKSGIITKCLGNAMCFLDKSTWGFSRNTKKQLFGVPCEHPLPLPLGEVAE